MNYLQLCQRLHQESGLSGAGPTTVVGQIGQLERLVSWVDQAWAEIQSFRPDWFFMNSEGTFNTVADTRDYDPASYGVTDLNRWDTDSFLMYETAIGTADQNELPFLDYQFWRPRYRARMESTPADKPILVTVLPNNNLRFEPKPLTVYTVTFEYKRTPQTLTDNTDTPTGLPEEFHMIIVWKALEYFAMFESAPELMTVSEERLNHLWPILEREQLARLTIGAEPIGW